MLDKEQLRILSGVLDEIERHARIPEREYEVVDERELRSRFDCVLSAVEHARRYLERGAGNGPEQRLYKAIQADDSFLAGVTVDFDEDPDIAGVMEDQLVVRANNDRLFKWAFEAAGCEERIEAGLANLAAATAAFVRSSCRNAEYARAIAISAREVQAGADRLEEINEERRGVMDR